MGQTFSCRFDGECVSGHRTGASRMCSFCRENIYYSLKNETDIKTATALLMNRMPSDGTIKNIPAFQSLIYITVLEGCLNAVENGILRSEHWGESNVAIDNDYVLNSAFIFREWEKRAVPVGLSCCVLEDKIVLGFHVDPSDNGAQRPMTINTADIISDFRNESYMRNIRRYGIDIRYGTDVCSFLCRLDFNHAEQKEAKVD